MFKKYYYTSIRVGLNPRIKIEKSYKDTSYRVIIINYKFIIRFLLKVRIYTIVTLF